MSFLSHRQLHMQQGSVEEKQQETNERNEKFLRLKIELRVLLSHCPSPQRDYQKKIIHISH